jgi:DNA (cytosine-5)-methyltransferase 1
MALKALDLFCSAGGASVGLYRAGFEVTGVDINPQPRYPFRFIQGDALAQDLGGYDLVWASPPCQAHTSMKAMHNAKRHADLIPATREKLKAWGGLYIIENVAGAPLESPTRLCGTMFGLGCFGAELRRHRLFESNFHVATRPCNHQQSVIGIYGGHVRNRRRDTNGNRGVDGFTMEDAQTAMGIKWMTLAELCQAIPPAYSEYLGLFAMKALSSEPRS